jgi:hypothetical protein
LSAWQAETKAEDHAILSSSAWLRPTDADRAAARRTHLLPFQPALQASKVEDMTARELLRAGPLDLAGICGIPGLHLFSADDTGVFPGQFVHRGIGVSVHVSERLAISK